MRIYEAREESGSVQVAAIPAELAEEFFPNVEEYAIRALNHAYDGMTVETLIKRIIEGNLILVVVTVEGEIRASMTVELCEIPMGRIAHCMTLSGDDLESWVDEFIDTWKALGEALDCDAITIKGRAGWERYARRYGFKHMYTNMYLPLSKSEDKNVSI